MLSLNFKRKTSPQFVFLYFAPIVLGFVFLLSANSFLRDLSVVEQGLNICELRVLQSYTTFVRFDRSGRSNSHYLTSRFMDETENCFAEIIGKVETSGALFSSISKDVLNQLNQVQNNVHWFHSSLKREKSLLANAQNSAIGRKYSDVEVKKDFISNILSTQRERVYAVTKLLGLPIILLALVLTISIFAFFRSVFIYRSKLKGFDQDAQKLIYNGESWNTLELQDLVTRALQSADLNSLAEVARRWTKYSQKIIEETKPLVTSKAIVQREITKEEISFDKEIEVIQEEVIENSAPVVGVEIEASELSLDQSVTRIVELLASKIFTYGINFQILVDEGIVFDAQGDFKEYLDQIILSFLGPLLTELGSQASGNKKITLTTTKRTDGDTQISSVDLALAPTPAIRLSEEEFVLPLSLLKEIGGSAKIQDNGTIWMELPLKINFKAVENTQEKSKNKNEQKLVHLFRGKKKDLLKDFGIS